MPSPEAAKMPAHDGSLAPSVMTRPSQVSPPSSETLTAACRIWRLVGSMPVADPPKPWSKDFTWKLKMVPVSRSTT
ncbi:hypothetical protein D3C74_434460 [compost metagenome]